MPPRIDPRVPHSQCPDANLPLRGVGTRTRAEVTTEVGSCGYYSVRPSATLGNQFHPASWAVEHSLGVEKAEAAVALVYAFDDRKENRKIAAVLEHHFRHPWLARGLET